MTSHAPADDRFDGAGSCGLAGWLVLATLAVSALAALRRPIRVPTGRATYRADNAAAS